MRIVELEDLSLSLLRLLVEMYRRDPITHVYLLYDIIYESESTDAVFALESGSEIAGYVLIWHGGRRLGVHVWGEARQLLDTVSLKGPAVVQLYGEGLAGRVMESLGSSARLERFVDMAVDEDGFRAWSTAEAVRLRADKEEHVEAFSEFSKARKRFLGDPQELLKKWRYYGVFVEDRLVSVACAYIRMPEVWCIGDVYTLEEHRGRGYGKTVTSAITRDAVSSGAIALLHVAEDNAVARRVYRALGFRALRTRPWILA